MAAGVPHTTDFNGLSQEGAGYYQLTTKDGRRCSTAVAYLKPVLSRNNLELITDAAAERLLHDGKRVTGVTFLQGAQSKTVRARREIILSAGAIGSPQILQLSGIGPGAALGGAGIDVEHDLPGVGENLQDHLQVRFVYETTLRDSLNTVWHSRTQQVRAGLDYMFSRQGIFTIGAGVAGVFSKSRPELEAPDMQIHFMPLSSVGPGQGLHKYPGVTASVCQLRPDSRGTLKVTSSSRFAKPDIVSNYLAQETDKDVLLRGLHLLTKISRQPEFAQFVAREVYPGDDVVTDDDLMSYARDIATTIFHPCGTCKMRSDNMAVVDERLRIRGLDGLRVADASIMPTMTSGNTNAPTIMIGEKASDMVLEDAQLVSTAA